MHRTPMILIGLGAYIPRSGEWRTYDICATENDMPFFSVNLKSLHHKKNNITKY